MNRDLNNTTSEMRPAAGIGGKFKNMPSDSDPEFDFSCFFESEQLTSGEWKSFCEYSQFGHLHRYMTANMEHRKGGDGA